MQAQDSGLRRMRTNTSAMNLCHSTSGLLCPGVAQMFVPYIIRNALLLSFSLPEMRGRGGGSVQIFATNL